ncbi:hypothetical protein HDU78_000274 [Chytriomyces hyalinus]|nr:hypothetical protein HDU78_000274 [Chytriomyces hyalinus]
MPNAKVFVQQASDTVYNFIQKAQTTISKMHTVTQDCEGLLQEKYLSWDFEEPDVVAGQKKKKKGELRRQK